MKKQFYVQAVVLILFLVSTVGCSSSRNTSSSRTPSSTRTSKSQHPGVRTTGIYLPGSEPSTAGMPPGQAKKVVGAQSAKEFAPGQQKKALKEGKYKGKKGKKGKKK
ncbi:hypothetical protein FHS90_002472 [Rufibacter quisquiliarum]|uniref:Lipoprotein n=1 Tax=Rufibacter quisquiliarum TaxID=1549639 RepID=A0A839GJ58_9BACT|nr:hypothetical protein [Rufibacter quisquiliarum]